MSEVGSKVELGKVNFGDLHRLAPVSPRYGFGRGKPVDRYYIESFLSNTSGDVRGTVLEVGDDLYSKQFGTTRVVRQHILDISRKNSRATIVGDLSVTGLLPAETFDCIILTQTLQFVFDVSTALGNLYHSLKPGGVLLLTVPGISQIDSGWMWYWTFTRTSVSKLLSDVFGDSFAVTEYGNVFAATVFLQGIVLEEVDTNDLNVFDPRYPVIIAARAQKCCSAPLDDQWR